MTLTDSTGARIVYVMRRPSMSPFLAFILGFGIGRRRARARRSLTRSAARAIILVALACAAISIVNAAARGGTIRHDPAPIGPQAGDTLQLPARGYIAQFKATNQPVTTGIGHARTRTEAIALAAALRDDATAGEQLATAWRTSWTAEAILTLNEYTRTERLLADIIERDHAGADGAITACWADPWDNPCAQAVGNFANATKRLNAYTSRYPDWTAIKAARTIGPLR